ncbi:hypothetical protein OEZ85_002865 [Tetradesmus obliquus]|uniref:Major facilitator superfamily (MFS) profile domain-containing protein n=1 Tax=Tetradesmus obliquus TaxID=3088 RepID=A0ABY8TYV3_TETOB|nr:hypothetical protein OEZ85_002865 [Tetradesmus obliquus]
MRACHQGLTGAGANATHRQLRQHGLPLAAKLATSSSAHKQGLSGMLQHRQRHPVFPTAAAASGGSSGGTGNPAATQPQQQGLSPPGTSISRSSSSSASSQNDVESGLQRGSGSNEPQNRDWLKLVTVAAIGIVICYADRSNMSTAILPMAEAYHWDKAFEGVILSAFFAGYAATQVLGGSLADRYGGKFVLTTGVFLWSLFTVLTPGAAAAGTVPLLAARVLLGVGEGVAFPSIHSMIARNVPTSKRSTAVGIITAASYAGTALAFGLSPWLISRFSWQWVFYLFGGSALLWLPFWLPLNSYGMYGLLTWLPTFFTDFYGVKLVDLGGYTLLPYLLQGVVGLGAGALADQLLSSRGWSVRSVRVGLQLAGMLGPAACLMAAVSPIVGGSAEAASALITVGLGLSALTLGAVSVNHLDIAPRHAGMVFGAGNTAATLAGLVSVPLTGWVLQRTGSWPIVFGLIGVHFVVGSAIWAAWVGDKPLPEDGPDEGAALPAPSAR